MFQSSPSAAARCQPPGAGAPFRGILPIATPRSGRTRALIGVKVSILLALYGCGGVPTETPRGPVTAETFEGATIMPERAAVEPTPDPVMRPLLPRTATEPLLDAAREVEADTAAQMVALFDDEDYDLGMVRSGADGVPRLLIARLPEDYTSKLRGSRRKSAFLRAVLPLVLEANRQILLDRRRALSIIYGEQTSDADREWLAELADRYRVEPGDNDELLRRVHTVPISLALAQAALESGWGTSRFAQDGNALYGQWTWKKGAGIAPSERQAHQKFSIRKFPTLYDAVRSYMNNLNVSSHYTAFRELRAELSRCRAEVSGSELTPTLTRYSIEREAYVRKLDQMIRHNRLQDFDTAQFRGTEEPFQQSRLMF